MPSSLRARPRPPARSRRAALSAGLVVLLAGCGRAEPAPAGGLAPDGRAVYAAASPALAYVETPLGSGSAVVFDGRHALTNAHVVWPYDRARVLLPGAGELASAPVVGRDLMADLAVLDLVGMADGPLPSLGASSGEALAPGSPVFLVGFPAEVEPAPQAAISQGVLSRHRRWAAEDLDYLQTDADIAGGQSGGALLDAEGRWIGHSSLFFGETGFALAASAPDVLARAEALLQGADLDGLAGRRLPEHGGETRTTARLPDANGEAIFFLDAVAGRPIWLRLPADAGAQVELVDPYGELVEPAEGRVGDELRYEPWTDGPHAIAIAADEASSIALESSEPLRAYADPDDGAELGPDAARRAALDFAGDVDTYYLEQPADLPLRVVADSVNFLPELWLEPLEGDPEEGYVVGRSGYGNALGMAALAELPASPRARSWLLTVRDLDAVGNGGYWLRVEPVEAVDEPR